MGLIHLIFLMAIVLFIFVTLSACNTSGNVLMKRNEMVIENLRSIYVPIRINIKSDKGFMKAVMNDTTTNNEILGDFRYDNMFK